MNKRITQADVARLANVTRQTVSLVVNNDPRVNKETRKRILQIMEELDYHPNITARNLASKQSRCIGYHYFNLVRESFSLPLFSQSLSGIYFRSSELGYRIQLYPLSDSQDYSTSYRSGEIDGAIFVTNDKQHVEEQLIPMLEKGFPLIIIGSHPDIPHVNINHAHGAELAVQQLAKKKARIAYLGGGLDFQSNQQKFQAYQKYLQAKGESEDSGLIHHNLYLVQHGYDAIRHMITDGVEFDAVFSAVNDQVAVGACQALNESGRIVPDDVAVMGYDDSVYAQFSIPPLSSVASPFFEIGQTAVDMILDFIKNEEPPESISLEPQLVLRASTG